MKDQRKVNTIKLMADSDRNGNPQRGWLVMTRAGELLCFIDDGFVGWAGVRAKFPNAKEAMVTIPVSAAVYRRAIKSSSATGRYPQSLLK